MAQSNAVAVANAAARLATVDDPILSDEKLWQVVSSGDLKGLSPKQKSDYYLYRCRVEGLNPAAQPFQYMTLQGKEILYAGKAAADQLRKLHGISIVSCECRDDGEYIECEVRVRDREGREDYETGIVFVGTAKGVERANARMKALTKAKRRATYSICGTGVLDETEVETIPGARSAASDAIPERQIEAPPLNVVVATDQQVPAPPVNLNDDIKRLREVLGWSAQNVIDMAKDHGWDLRKRDGLQAAHDRLQEYVDNALAGDGDTEEIIDADYQPVMPGMPAQDRWTDN